MSEPGPLRRPRPFWHRHLDPEERRRVMHDLALVNRTHWTWRFVIMLTLSVLVAVMGLMADSAAVVIGAMLLAPLMTPVLGTAAAISMGLPRKIFQSGSRVVLATGWCIVLAFAARRFDLNKAQEFSSEVISRTSPNLRDLVVALAAGTAGAYATVRTDTSGALPGVAVAVALVPPLATVGITLEAGNNTYATGAFLLYTTNLVAIVFAGIIVFVATGFVPPRRLVTTVPRILGGLALAVVAVVVITVPLTQASRAVAVDAERERDVREAVDAWLAGTGLLVERIDVGDTIVVEVFGVTEPPPKEDLEQILASVVDPLPPVAVLFDERREPTTTTIAVESDAERREAAIRFILEEWLAQNDRGNDYVLQSFTVTGREVLVVVSGTGQAPPILDLIDRLAALPPDDAVTPSLRWSELQSVPITEPGPSPRELRLTELGETAQAWADRFAVDLVSVELGPVAGADPDGAEELRVIVEGPVSPPLEPLLEAMADVDPDLSIDALFTLRIPLVTTTTTIPLPEILRSDAGSSTTTTTAGSATTSG